MPNKNPRPAEIRTQSEVLLDEAMGMELRLSENDSDYSYVYLGEKLTKVSHYLEKLGQISMKLSKVALEIIQQVSDVEALLRLKEREFKDSKQYRDTDRDEKSLWLSKKLEVYKDETDSWRLTSAFLREVREAVNERIQMFKRLDSDLRLQYSILSSKEAAGLGSGSPAYKPESGSSELEI